MEQKDKDLIAHVTLNGATVMDRLLDKKKLPFLGGGPIVMRETLADLKRFDLIREDRTAPAGWSLSKKGHDVCYALWGDKYAHCGSS